jgi:O-succinylbenzoic acid--CoA ligase
VGLDSQQFWCAIADYQTQLADIPPGTRVLITEASPLQFLAGTLAACWGGCSVYLGNPTWAVGEWQPVLHQVAPQIIWGTLPTSLLPTITTGDSGPAPTGWATPEFPPGAIYVPTGGSSGRLPFIIHTWTTLAASVRGFQQHFQVASVNAFCVLPLYHVSGLMQAIRVLLTGGRLAVQPFKALEAGHYLPLNSASTFLSLVPTQLQRLLLREASVLPWLRSFRAVLVGGAPAWPALLENCQSQGLPLALTYGMTETASQVATLLPAAFLAGQRGSGPTLPHVRIDLCDAAGHPLAPGQVGQIRILGPSVALGYQRLGESGSLCRFPTEADWQGFSTLGLGHQARWFLPDDLGWLDGQGGLHVVGRNSTKIITGGENVFPEEIEGVVQSTGLVKDICVVGVADREWGQRVTAVYVPGASGQGVDALKGAIAPHLSKYKHPKQWIPVASLPRTAAGKINRKAVAEWIDHWGASGASI